MKIDSATSRASFGEKASSYEEYALVQSDAAAWLAEWVLQTDCPSCLEFGAGTGLLTHYLEGNFKDIECSDIEPAMVELCREKFPTIVHSIRDAWPRQADKNKWGLVTASSLLQWADDPETVIRNWSELLTENGKIISGLFIEPSLPEMYQVTGGKTPLIWRDISTWKELVKSAGMKVERIEEKTVRYYYKSALDLWKTIHETGTAVSRKISPSQMMRFFRDYESRFQNEKGVYATWTFCRLELAISK